MNWYNAIKHYHEANYYTDEDAKVFVAKGKINEADYEAITGIPYVV